CPRWDRWHIRTSNSEDQQKLIRLYRKSGAKTKSDFVRARLLGESFKVITQDPTKEPYLEKLSEIVAMTNKIGVLYNEAVKALNTYHSVATAQQLLGKLETYSQLLIRLQQQAVQLTKSLESKQERRLINHTAQR
ncbi:plasmid mobilization protein, partial [Prevotella corporis]